MECRPCAGGVQGGAGGPHARSRLAGSVGLPQAFVRVFGLACAFVDLRAPSWAFVGCLGLSALVRPSARAGVDLEQRQVMMVWCAGGSAGGPNTWSTLAGSVGLPWAFVQLYADPVLIIKHLFRT